MELDSNISQYKESCFVPANGGHVQVISLWKTLVFILIFQLLSTGSGGLTACVLGGPRRPMLTICSKEDFILKGKFRLNGTERVLFNQKSSNLHLFRNLVPMRIVFLSSFPVWESFYGLPTLLEQWKQRCPSFLIKGTLCTQLNPTDEKYKTTARRAGLVPRPPKKAALERVY